MKTIPVVALAVFFFTQALNGQIVRRIDAAPVIGGALFASQLPDSVQVSAGKNQTTILRGIGLNDALVMGGHLTLWLSSMVNFEASAVFIPSHLHGDKGTGVDVSAFTLGGRFIAADGRRLRPYWRLPPVPSVTTSAAT